MSNYTKHQNKIFELVWTKDKEWEEAAEKLHASPYRLKSRLLRAMMINELGRPQ